MRSPVKKSLLAVALAVTAVVGAAWALSVLFRSRGVDPSFVSASVVSRSNKRQIGDHETTALSSWLSNHSSGWQIITVTAKPGDEFVELAYINGRRTRLEMYMGTRVIMAYADDHSSTRTFSEEDFAELLRILEIGDHPTGAVGQKE